MTLNGIWIRMFFNKHTKSKWMDMLVRQKSCQKLSKANRTNMLVWFVGHVRFTPALRNEDSFWTTKWPYHDLVWKLLVSRWKWLFLTLTQYRNEVEDITEITDPSNDTNIEKNDQTNQNNTKKKRKRKKNQLPIT